MWASERRLLALAGPQDLGGVTPVVVDPQSRRVVHRSSWRGRPIRWAPAGERLVFLAADDGGTVARHGRLLSFDAGGRLRELGLSRIEAGSWRTGRRSRRHVEPGLAVTEAGDRAYVVAADERLVADVDLRRWRLAYREASEARSALRQIGELIDPPAYAKAPVDATIRTAQALPGGVIAVTGEDQRATGSAHEPRTFAHGVRLIDPASWTWRAIDQDAQHVTVAGGVLLARRWTAGGNSLPSIGVRAYDASGKLRFSRFADARTIVFGAGGDYAYVGVQRPGARPST